MTCFTYGRWRAAEKPSRGSGQFTTAERGTFRALIVDEAHRLNEKSGLYQNLGDNQVKELIHADDVTVFFLDEDQRVTLQDIGTRDEIDYDLRVLDAPGEVWDFMRERNGAGSRSRMVAGYCWDWRSKKDPRAWDVELPEHDFRMRWNLTKHGSGWLARPDSIEEIGCIHTCQGLELDYVGVVIGPDLVVRDGALVTDACLGAHLAMGTPQSHVHAVRVARSSPIRDHRRALPHVWPARMPKISEFFGIAIYMYFDDQPRRTSMLGTLSQRR